ncbi:MAG: response regulator [Nitrospirae bacterium YQR-1]
MDKMVTIEKLKNYSTGITVLYAEDSVDIREETAAFLKSFFKVVDVAENGNEAIKLYNTCKYDIVISDVRMPELDGIGLTRKIKEIDPEQIVIITTAYDNSPVLYELINLGVDKFITKPVLFEKLLAVLLEISERIHHKKEDFRNVLLNTRISAMNEILVNIAHHWRQPLTAVGAIVQEIYDIFMYQDLTRESLIKNVSEATRIIKSMSDIIDKFSTCYNSNNGKEDFSIEHAVADAVFIVKDAMCIHGIDLVREIEKNSIIKGNRANLAYIIVEILCNSIDAAAMLKCQAFFFFFSKFSPKI